MAENIIQQEASNSGAASSTSNQQFFLMGEFKITLTNQTNVSNEPTDLIRTLCSYLSALHTMLAGNNDAGMANCYYMLNPAVTMAKMLNVIMEKQHKQKIKPDEN